MYKCNIILSALLFVCTGCKQRYKEIPPISRPSGASRQIEYTLKTKSKEYNVIPDSRTAFIIAETLLLNKYDKKNVRKQRPYSVGLVDDFWVISGSLPHDFDGGAYEVIINKDTGEVVFIGLNAI